MGPLTAAFAWSATAMMLSKHFHLSEFTTSQKAARQRLDNTPSWAITGNLERLAATMEKVRPLLGNKPILITSGYRSPAVNRAVGGSRTSAHMRGEAADFICPGFGTPLEICRAIAASDIGFDQLIEEGTWVHLGIGGHWRREVLTWDGETYTKGLR